MGSNSSEDLLSNWIPCEVPDIMTVPGVISDAETEYDFDSEAESIESLPSTCPRTILVANHLPVRTRKGPEGWSFELDHDSLLLQLKQTMPSMEFTFIGCLREEIPVSDQETVGRILESFNMVPVFVEWDLYSRFYHGFCKDHLWPLFHSLLPLSSTQFDRELFQAYVSVNKMFVDKVISEVINPDSDFVWIHDYHLMILPTFLRKKVCRVKLGFFLHSPFPSSEIYKTLPVREEILRSLLNSDLIGFHTFDYARHFLSCCSRMLGLTYESKRGYVGIEYYGRTVTIKILPVGIHMGQLQSVLSQPETKSKVKELIEQFPEQGKVVILGVDDMDIFKGINLKLLAMEKLLLEHPRWRGKAVLVQIANPARGKGKDVKEVQAESYATAKRINEAFRLPGYEPVVLIDKPLQFYERMAYYVVSECCLVTAVKDGMNLIPYEYVVARQGNKELDEILGLSQSCLKRSMLVISEFIGCSPSLSGAIRVNPWNIETVADAIHNSFNMRESEPQLRHEKHYRYVSTHDVGYWAKSFLQDLERTCVDHTRRMCCGIGFGLKFRVVTLDTNFRKLSVEDVYSAYERTSTRAILLDYDGTLMPQMSIDKTPDERLIATLNNLCRDKNNLVFIVSARSRSTLDVWFANSENLGIAAENGCFFRFTDDWEQCVLIPDNSWKQIAEPVMKLYTETTDGSTIEEKETALVWSYEDADPDFGSCQAKELLDHLESVLANEPVSVKAGSHIVEVKPQGVSKGLVAERLVLTMKERNVVPDFALSIGDDHSDEDMFEVISAATMTPSLTPSAEVFACTVGRKPSKAEYYLDDTAEIVRLMEGLATRSNRSLLNSLNLSG